MSQCERASNTSYEADLAVIGGGGAGLSAAVAAVEKGAKVIVLEARSIPGGNSVYPLGFFAVDTRQMSESKIAASQDNLFLQAMRYTHWKTNSRLMRTLIEKSGDTIRWFEDKGLQFEPLEITPGNPIPMFIPHKTGPGKGGAQVVRTLVKACQDLGVTTLCHTRARKLLTDRNGRLTGAIAITQDREFTIQAKSLVVSTGGFAGNQTLLKKLFPSYNENEVHLAGLPHQGDGMRLVSEIGADINGAVVIEMNGPEFPWSWNISTMCKHPGTLWVNKRGERFTSEAVSAVFPEAANSLFRQPGKMSYTLFDEPLKRSMFVEEIDPLARHMITSPDWEYQSDQDFQSQAEKARVKKADSWEALAQWMEIDTKTLETTLGEYNTCCEQQHDHLFAKEAGYLRPLRTPPYYAIKCCINFFVTHGGIKTNHRMEVLDRNDLPIQGLYAAGVDTEGTDSDTYNYALPGHSLGFSLNTGRIAGENAAEFSLSK